MLEQIKDNILVEDKKPKSLVCHRNKFCEVELTTASGGCVHTIKNYPDAQHKASSNYTCGFKVSNLYHKYK